MTTQEATEVYSSTTSRLTLPPSARWRPLRTSEGKFRVAYTRDQAVSAAESQWVCAWEKEWVQAYGTDSEASEAAIKQLKAFPMMDEYKNQYGSELKGYFDQILLRAQLGDAAPMRKEVEVNCP